MEAHLSQARMNEPNVKAGKYSESQSCKNRHWHGTQRGECFVGVLFRPAENFRRDRPHLRHGLVLIWFRDEFLKSELEYETQITNGEKALSTPKSGVMILNAAQLFVSGCFETKERSSVI